MGNFLGDQVTVIILTTIQLHSASYLRGKTQEFCGFRKRVTESKLKYLQVYYHKKPGVFRGGKNIIWKAIKLCFKKNDTFFLKCPMKAFVQFFGRYSVGYKLNQSIEYFEFNNLNTKY